MWLELGVMHWLWRSKRCVRTLLGLLCLVSQLPQAAAEDQLKHKKQHKTGLPECPCLDATPMLANVTVNSISNQKSRYSLSESDTREAVQDCLVADNIDRLQRPGESYCYPTDYGRGRCDTWDLHLPPECARDLEGGAEGIMQDCKGTLITTLQDKCLDFFPEKPGALPWCSQHWCYIDPNNCESIYSPSYVFPGRTLYYSYETCGSNNYFELWGAPLFDMCQKFEVVEKPYPIMWFSCWACAFMQQIIDATRYFDEQQDRLSRGQRLYLVFQLCVLISETIANFHRIPWFEEDRSFWMNYNLYVYVFIHSSVFVRATMMSQIVWDWYEVKLLKYPTVHATVDGKGWTDEKRALLLVIIFQFMSSLMVFGCIAITHLIPALIVYYWIFLLISAGLVKSRTWVANIGFDPAESRFGRALVMGTNSFMSCMGIQVLVTSMVRVYAGEWESGYLVPLTNDFLSRRVDVWYACHLGKVGFSTKLFKDQDFINLFLR